MAEAEFDQSMIDEAMGQLDDTAPGLQRVGQADRREDQNLFVRFFFHPHLDKEKTDEAGRPIYYDREYIEIIVPGDRNNTVNRPVRDSDKQRFPRMYQAFKQGAQQRVTGTPLESWPLLNRSQVEELKHFRIYTVEQLANVPDNLKQQFMGINALQQRAKDFIEAARGVASTQQFRDELEKKDAQISALTQAVNELTQAVKELKTSKSKANVEKADKALEAATSATGTEVIDDDDLEEEDR